MDKDMNILAGPIEGKLESISNDIKTYINANVVSDIKESDNSLINMLLTFDEVNDLIEIRKQIKKLSYKIKNRRCKQ